MAEAFGTSERKIKDAIHEIKRNRRTGSGGAGRRNPDVEIDLETGDVFIEGTVEHIDNIFDYLD